MLKDPVVIISAMRTPIGAFQGALSTLSAPKLGGFAIKAVLERSGLDVEEITNRVEEVIMGCVLPAGVGQAPARQAAINANLPLSTGCTTVNKVCGSGMKSVMLAHDLLLAGTNRVMIAGGMESMSNAPYLLTKARGGYRLGDGVLVDHMFFDGLEDSYYPESRGRLMGTFAEECASQYHFTRKAQDDFSIESTKRAREAIEQGSFKKEIVSIVIHTAKGEIIVTDDEQPSNVNLERVSKLKPTFRKNGTVTAANSSSISDGAAALLLMQQSTAEKLGAKPIATIIGHTTYAQEPRLFTTAPVGAMQSLLKKVGWKVDDVDLWEINEAFAVVTMAAMEEMKLDHKKVNIHGGACALGHPIGASGARIITTLINALKVIGKKRGIATLCIGGGEATAMAIELI